MSLFAKLNDRLIDTQSRFYTFILGETNLASMLDDLTLQSHDICRDLYCLVPSIGARSQQLQQQLGTAANLQIGHYTLEWRRTSVDG